MNAQLITDLEEFQNVLEFMTSTGEKHPLPIGDLPWWKRVKEFLYTRYGFSLGENISKSDCESLLEAVGNEKSGPVNETTDK